MNSIESFAKDVTKEASQNQWVNIRTEIAGKIVGIKAYGKWVQRIEVNSAPYQSGEFKTQKAMREFIVNAINNA